MIVKTQHFDPSKHYPVIENIYAGPHDSFVPKDFWPFGYHSGGDKVIGMQALANLGFIVVQMDGMGTANRSKAFHDVAWKNLGDSGFPDRILWHQAAAKKFPWYDISKGVGIYGASAGGQSTLSALLFHPDFYTVGVAFAGCYDNRMDKMSWNEQWMGWPVDESYLRSSAVV
ncbi:MAG: S9 family peptidase, partial [Shewanella fodinae]|nr:S9 family peptidase [Shewanella fodinae]